MVERSFLEQILLDEIQGKNGALHAYNRIIWTIRTGFVTVFFSAWGILLSGLAREEADVQLITKLVIPIWILSVGLSLCAWWVDRHHIRRKLRVVSALNATLAEIADHANAGSDDEEGRSPLSVESTKQFLTISGDSGDRSYEGAGYVEEKRACMVIYTLPCTTIAIGLACYTWMIG